MTNNKSLMKRSEQRQLNVIFITILALFFTIVSLFLESSDYRRAIYSIERESGVFSTLSDTTDAVRIVGKPNTDYHELPRKPKHRHFWD